MSVTPFVMIFFVLGIATLGLAVYRWLIAKGEQDIVRLGPGEGRDVSEQVDLDRRLKSVDSWGKTLTALTVVVGLILAGMYLNMAWHDPSSVPNTFYRR